jgi:hypothetical protein
MENNEVDDRTNRGWGGKKEEKKTGKTFVRDGIERSLFGLIASNS